MKRVWLLATLFVAGCGDFEIVVPETLSATIVPQHGSIEVSPDVEIFVFFGQSVLEPNDAIDDIELRCVGGPPCQQPVASACNTPLPVVRGSFDAVGQTARLLPTEPLQSDACFVIAIEAGIEAEDEDTGPFPAEVRSSFQTGSAR
ncbi:MAG: hypothetical protein AAF605_04640 [Myxococcota bacterium]